MKTIRASIKTVLPVLTVMSFTVAFVRADSYSLTNLQSDIPGLAAHVDPNLVNPWGMAVPAATGPRSGRRNGTRGSTLYKQADGTLRSLSGTGPASPRSADRAH